MRTPLFFMAFLVLLLVGILSAASAEANDLWASLWRTPDQRGEQLLRQGDAAAAARTYADPRRRAYAELQAGDDAAAARDFAAFGDSDAQYNRGNALAKSGSLQDAIKAYDAALARNPDNQDARHNRDLVAKALSQQPPDQQQKQAQSSASKDASQSGQDRKQDSGSQGQAGQPQDAKDQAQENARQQASGKAQTPSQAQSQTSPAGTQSASSQGDSPKPSPAGKDQQQNDRNDGHAGDQDRPLAQSQGEPPSQQDRNGQNPSATDQPEDSASQARRDAEAGLKRPEDGKGLHPAASGDPLQSKPMTEQQLAQAQWLRQIPDDPGGLLRRKFMIEHLLRQQGQQQP